MKIMITGIGGSIGSHLWAHVMHNTDWDVIGVDSFRHKGIYARLEALSDKNPEWFDRTTIITHDLEAPFSKGQLEKIGDIDYIVNLASLCDVWDSVADPVPFVTNNTNLMLTMLEFARLVKPKAFVQFSTDEVYGATDGKFAYKEWSDLVPSNPYAASKAMQEVLAISYWRSYGVPLIITNTMNNFGEAQGPSKYPVIIQKKLEDDETITVHCSSNGEIGSRSYIHSRNVADAVLFILNNTTPTEHVAGKQDLPDRYNIAGERYISNLEIAQIIARLMGKELKYKLVDFHSKEPGHDLHYGLDGTKLRELGWTPPVSLEEGLKNTIKWQQERPEWIQSE
jgi:dTDP-glucose 4,6-dehydratase